MRMFLALGLISATLIVAALVVPANARDRKSSVLWPDVAAAMNGGAAPIVTAYVFAE